MQNLVRSKTIGVTENPWGVVVMLVVRVVWVSEWMIVLLAVPLARVVWALA